MDNSIKELIRAKIETVAKGFFGEGLPPFTLERAKKKEWGDLSTNLPFLLAEQAKDSPHTVGESLVSQLGQAVDGKILAKVEFASPGFVNFFLSPLCLHESLRKILQEQDDFTRFSSGKGKSIQVEFVSANPTGPLHVGHGRAAALGDVLANNLAKLGFEIQREYYVNDVGGQMNRLVKSLWVRMKQLAGDTIELPEDGYRGDYLIAIAQAYIDSRGAAMDGSFADTYPQLLKFLIDEILSSIKNDLQTFGVNYDHWFFESEIYRNGELEQVLSLLKAKGLIYKKDAALWFKTSQLMDAEQDRVVQRKNGAYTYFATDIAYHLNKLKRGFYKIIDIWGADHIGYVPRMMSAARAIGYPEEKIKLLIYQLVTLKRAGKRVSASTRTGEFISFRELIEEVGKDAARFFFLSRSADSHLEFDLELAKKQTSDNPVFYVQYACARISSILRKVEEENFLLCGKSREINFNPVLLDSPEERELMLLIALLPDQIKEAAQRLEPHHLTTYATALASAFHYFYTKHRVITEDEELTRARIFLVQAVRIAIKDILSILGIFAPEKM